VGFGYQFSDPQLSGANLNMMYTMGYGYGTSRYGDRAGGFGMTLLSTTGQPSGGVGGLLVGHEWREGSAVGAVTLLGGVGGVGTDTAGYMILFGEADVEFGVWITRWMEISAYAGYQAWGNMVPGPAFTLLTNYTPVLGIRLAWGGSR
jgi:hypothetical protein